MPNNSFTSEPVTKGGPTTLGKILLGVLAIAIIGVGVYFGWPLLKKATKDGKTLVATEQTSSTSKEVVPVTNISGGKSKVKPEMVISLNTWSGFAPVVWMNDGKAANKTSRMYTEFGLKLQINQMDVRTTCIEALKSGQVDAVYTTTDISPTEMGAMGDLAKIGVVQILKIDDSRGADVIVAMPGINSVADMKGKKVAYAEGTASHSLLLNVLETAGLTMADIIPVKVTDGIEAASRFKGGVVDVAVVWSPDDGDCIAAFSGAHRLASTEDAPYIIMDGLLTTKANLEDEDKFQNLVKLCKAWLTANAEMVNATKREAAAKTFAKAFEFDEFVVLDGVNKVRFSTYGDNLNFFGLNPQFTGVTGEKLYSRMSIVYGDLGLSKSPLPWKQVSESSVIEAIKDLTDPMHAAEGSISFAPATSTEIAAPALATKRVTVNFPTNSANLDEYARTIINREMGGIAQNFANVRVRIEGNTDNTGDFSYNVELSKKRAQAVADYLVKYYKFDKNRFIVIGNGPSKPLAGNSTEAGRAANRRTDFELVK